MTAGFLAHELTARALLSVGFGSRDLFFHTGDERRRLVVGYADHPRAYRCSYCGVITLPPDGTGEAVPCSSCGQIIPAAHTTCPSCGWSYQAPQKSDVADQQT